MTTWLIMRRGSQTHYLKSCAPSISWILGKSATADFTPFLHQLHTRKGNTYQKPTAWSGVDDYNMYL